VVRCWLDDKAPALIVPRWMLDEKICGMDAIAATARVDVDALVEMRALLAAVSSNEAVDEARQGSDTRRHEDTQRPQHNKDAVEPAGAEAGSRAGLESASTVMPQRIGASDGGDSSVASQSRRRVRPRRRP
jgi:hypothetical protein